MRKAMVYALLLLLVAVPLHVHAKKPIDESTAKRLLTQSFFVFDNGAGRGQWTPRQQAETLAKLGYAGRVAHASPATGSRRIHRAEQTALLDAAFKRV